MTTPSAGEASGILEKINHWRDGNGESCLNPVDLCADIRFLVAQLEQVKVYLFMECAASRALTQERDDAIAEVERLRAARLHEARIDQDTRKELASAIAERDEWKATAGKEAKMRDDYASSISELRAKLSEMSALAERLTNENNQLTAKHSREVKQLESVCSQVGQQLVAMTARAEGFELALKRESRASAADEAALREKLKLAEKTLQAFAASEWTSVTPKLASDTLEKLHIDSDNEVK